MNCKILNLIKPALSDIPYHINKYPDGHKHIVLEDCEWNKDSYLNVITRISSMDDLFILRQVDNILWHENIRISELVITYLLTARCDRRFSLGEAIDRDIVAMDLYSLHADRIVFYDLHSEPDILTRNYRMENLAVIKDNFELENYNICFPDKGACDRYAHLCPQYNLVGEKHRKPDGISITVNSIKPLDIDKPILVIDDLCDGGGTFVALANELNELCPKYKREIWVTHAIQKSGIRLLAAKYDKVYITNSYTDWASDEFSDNVTVYDVCQ